MPYRGGAPLNQDLAAGHIDLTLGMAASTYPLVRSGQIKAYAMMTQARWWAAPDVPTMEEEGVPGLYASFWHGLWVPKGTPKDVITRLNSAVRSALADPTVRQRFGDQGQEVPPPEQQSPEALGAHQQAEIEKWWPIIKAAGIKAMCCHTCFVGCCWSLLGGRAALHETPRVHHAARRRDSRMAARGGARSLLARKNRNPIRCSRALTALVPRI